MSRIGTPDPAPPALNHSTSQPWRFPAEAVPLDFYQLPTTRRDRGDTAAKGGHVDKTYLLVDRFDQIWGW